MPPRRGEVGWGGTDRIASGARPRTAQRPERRRPAAPMSWSSAESLLEIDDQMVYGDPILGHAVPFPHGHLVIVQRVEIDRHAERRSHLVLPSIPAADG